ncbi:FliM/FliN family flagellar motor C-terminal domain-containing protein [Arsukibacterium perlucidum]|uniref:FliM/FliN family flagellar motor C-terminal domain-containing protein n=1 Tax=Arsukibacterium perlucidum TaxID=368811 RepID=UPI000364179E|nr:FliM/FliN family flagellar motor C-terminal domain-containing protein [Arsukibacterium perlucidum]
MQVKLAGVMSALQQQQLEHYCTQLADGWSKHWFGCAVDDCSINFNQHLFAELPALEDCQHCNQGVALHYQPKPTFNAVFSQALMFKPQPQDEADELLVKKFAATVLADLSARYTAAPASDDTTAELDQWQVELTLMINCQPVVIRLSASLVNKLLKRCSEPEVTIAKPALSQRQFAMQTALVSITPRLGPVSLPIKQLLSLQVGSVITLSQPISAPIPFYRDDKVVSITGYLVDQKGKKALYLSGAKHE